MPTSTTTTADLIFSDQANHNFSKTLGELKRSTLSIHNRLRSIEEDAAFAKRVRAAYGRPLIANERCGSWYIDPEEKAGSAYFKSTDGHTGVWKFSSRRLNLNLVETIGKNDGCIIIDSTRRGKNDTHMVQRYKSGPVSYRTPLPRFIHPPQVVSNTEHAQIFSLLQSFEKALKSLGVPLDVYKKQISKPLRPIWVTPDSDIASSPLVFEDFHPVICCTVSRRVAGGEFSEGGYIQGAGDDTENWAHGLTPRVFWANRESLFSTPEADLPDLISALVKKAAAEPVVGILPKLVEPTYILFVNRISGVAPIEESSSDLTIVLRSTITEEAAWETSTTRLDVGLGPHKLGSRNLRAALPFLVGFVEKNTPRLLDSTNSGRRIIIACETAKDLAIGLALTLLCLFFDGNGTFVGSASRRNIDKSFIRSRLGWISTSMPDANPSRATLQSVNSFLMERPK
ncbi:Uncharacterized protein LSUE1_G001513 [Lachnellula suecica]|uniref:tRNA A64-2'-O-ribosylphosphate transferase n=1 Tax=Lachnellula suecica TaxID=602035 RepID=A0A8T9CHH8_9HELO|nr:Uncharacterized protein LSUE1_G001513 [Lachnellula suecica]